ncbi:bifunctional tRNA (5-methylaminomethyl-2-thiouridine)(34)-methyltransferase MnmD/FAD-dependent 5-carboxymethylaminomethyl-2-thiouridine(34) oxidoreductase MnmC [Vibrio nitrifigilis]|uniref:tRNA 5-methylaminomethyl-2-thiouridine biosynthesis bifunctional protein MnmC n=1 Tax=Vibrio nitrifigilis TaxID=2789781 RepID=A0ABS0GAX4_9VIBR|nr:bifunctional tRNA (5-methylaminomethyl-2-thiouridine)(34)-methyltransferase MnmD/FAD-dependent 5-carboxymethylaminomethyl-2-thiouridine(34) oxidoreductase MnmC [Vibrio nitrifigilis]MBF8999511.1 bifunctional tRNA (5-methylaminomethyl-2-thiouridine)(34)-methyltransferase MnmD/FAD-dependent 5-carboxymethylaminomethyl-2-thiouridine(34) oxidoreductase MnmC [Vibrio nitrifigilis]
MTSITHAQLDWNDAGTPVSDQFDDVYFSNVNGLEETRYVFLTQNHLPERWLTFERKHFVVAETGFGTGLNFLALWQWFDAFKAQHPDSSVESLHFISFEKYPLSKDDLIKAHQSWPELADYAKQLQEYYPPAVPECHRIILADGAITLDLWFGDIKDCLPSVPTPKTGLVDAWFLDGFAPSKNPEMWNQELFNGMVKMARQECTVATFTAAGFVRRGLIEAGFTMKKAKGFGTKRDMIIGSLNEKKPYTNIKPWFERHGTDDLSDVAIIGGGIASATLAEALARRNIKVTLYCADSKPAQGASGNRQGAVYPLLNGNHKDVSRVFAPAFLYAHQRFSELAKSIEYDHAWCGVTQLMWDEKSSKKLSHLLNDQFDHELVTGLTPADTDRVTGVDIGMPAISYPLGGWLSPAQLTQGLITQLETSGQLSIRYQCPVTDLTHKDGQWQLSNGEQVFHHQAVVVATGHHFDAFQQTQAIPLSKVKGQVSHIPTNEQIGALKTVLCYDGYMTPVNPKNRHHCIGASYHRCQTDTEFDPQAQEENAQRLIHCLPGKEWATHADTSSNESRQGVRCVSRDHLPFVGNVGIYDTIISDYQNLHYMEENQVSPVAQYPDLYAFLGLGARGLSSSPLMAEMLAAQMCQEPLPLPNSVLETLHPSRMWVRKLRKGKAIVER